MKSFCFALVLVLSVYLTEAKSVGAPVVVAKRDVTGQAELLLKLAELLSKSKLAQELLEKEGKPLLAAGLKKIDELLHTLEEKVKNASPHTEIGKLAIKALDGLILKAEEKLEEELKKLQGSKTVAKREIVAQAELLLKLAELLSKSKLAQELLEKEGKPLLAAGLKKLDELLHSLEEKVKNASPHTEIGKLALKALDGLILKAEEKLEEELKKLQGSKTVVKRGLGTQAELLLKLAQLLSKSKLAQELLEKEGKPLLAAGIKKVDELLHSLETKVKNANPHTEFGKLILKGLDWLIQAAEHKLEEELTKLQGNVSASTPAYYEGIDIKDGLLKTAQQLKEAAEKAIAFLKAQGKSIEASELELLETVVMNIEKQLETLSPHTEIGKMLLTALESLLKNAETKLEELLKKLDAHP